MATIQKIRHTWRKRQPIGTAISTMPQRVLHSIRHKLIQMLEEAPKSGEDVNLVMPTSPSLTVLQRIEESSSSILEFLNTGGLAYDKQQLIREFHSSFSMELFGLCGALDTNTTYNTHGLRYSIHHATSENDIRSIALSLAEAASDLRRGIFLAEGIDDDDIPF